MNNEANHALTNIEHRHFLTLAGKYGLTAAMLAKLKIIE